MYLPSLLQLHCHFGPGLRDHDLIEPGYADVGILLTPDTYFLEADFQKNNTITG